MIALVESLTPRLADPLDGVADTISSHAGPRRAVWRNPCR
jgi:hypothetical protein